MEDEMSQPVTNVKKATVTRLDDTLMKTLRVSDYTDLWRTRVADIADTPGLLAEAVFQYATVVEKSELMGHLIRTGELCPQVRNLLLDIAARAGRKILLLKRLNAEQAAQATGPLETIEESVLEIAFANKEFNSQRDLLMKQI
jgi:hypothetical protein